MALNIARRLGIRIRQARKACSMTQEQLAERLGLTVESVSNIERGRTSARLSTLETISRELRVPLRDLFDGGQKDGAVSAKRVELEARFTMILRSLSENDLAIAVRQLEALSSRTK